MSAARVSVIIPAYNQSDFLPGAVASVLEQTYSDWELIVVDDGSTDATPEVMAAYQDARIHYIRQANRGLPGARNTGLQHAVGEFIAFLDSDDAFHPSKLETQVGHLDQNPELGLSYASRIEVDGEGKPNWFLRAPGKVGLIDLVLGFPFTINDLIVRRSWVEKVGGFDESFRLHSEDRDFYLRLALAGCCFGRARQFVAYRRLHPRRQFSKIPERIETMLRALNTAFEDSLCPAEVLAVRDQAYAKVYLVWACQEFVQSEVEAGQVHLRQAAELDPTIFALNADGKAARFLNYLVWHNVRDGSDHVEPLQRVLAHLPAEWDSQSQFQNWAVGQGYLIRGIRAVMWENLTDGKMFFADAVRLGARLDDAVYGSLTDQLTGVMMEYGARRAEKAVKQLTPFLKQVATESQIRSISGFLSVTEAYKNYRQGRYRQVPGIILQAILNDPVRLRDRGLLAMLARSLAGLVRS